MAPIPINKTEIVFPSRLLSDHPYGAGAGRCSASQRREWWRAAPGGDLSSAAGTQDVTAAKARIIFPKDTDVKSHLWS